MTSKNSTVLLNRHLSLKDVSPLALIVDSLAQSAHYLVQEYVHKSEAPVVLLSYECSVKPSWATSFLDCSQASDSQIQEFVREKSKTTLKSLVIIDSLNYVPLEKITSFISELMLPNNTTLGIFHSNCPQSYSQNYPAALSLLSFIALSTLHVEPLKIEDAEERENCLKRFLLPANCNLNLPIFKLAFTSKRKSGKSLLYHFQVNLELHEYDILKETAESHSPEEKELLENLTTFNLNTSDKQKIAREQVELPFMEAQAELGKMGGAIVYQFEKDDDYDEEDPYEDPF